jgi:hypothetical protein
MEIKECVFLFLPDTAVVDRYTCYITEAATTNPNANIKAFKRNHKPGKINEDVEGVFFR